MTNDETTYFEEHGIDYGDAMERFGGNDALYRRLAAKYLDDPHFEALAAAMSVGDAARAEREAHSLKGVAGNLSFSRLYDLASRITDALRAGDLEGARALMSELGDAHDAVVEALTRLQG